MEPTIQQVMEAVNALRAKMETPNPDVITRAEMEKAAEAAVTKLHPPERKAVMPETEEEVLARAEQFKKSKYNRRSLPWTSEYGKIFGDMRGFMKALRLRSDSLKTYSGMSEGTPANGGYLVPTEFNAEVIKLMQDVGIIMRLARVLPMSTWKRTFPVQLTNPSIYWVDEARDKTASKTTLTQFEQQAKVMAAVVKCTDELLRDSAINLQSFLAEIIAESMALEIERIALVGDVSGASDPFNGIRYASGVNVVSMSDSTVSFDDVADLIFSLSQAYAQDAKIITSRTGLKKLMKLKDENAAYIWQPPAGNLPPTIWNTPYEISGQIPVNLGTGTDETLAFFGRYDKYLFVSPREEIAVKASQDAYDSGDSTNAFLQDQTWMRFTQACSINVARGGSFSYLQFK